MNPARYFHTVRHLRPAQLWGRLARRLRRPGPDLRAAPPVREAPSDWQLPAARRPSLLAPRTFRFLNEDGALPSVGGWAMPDRSMLWRYNLHYFDDLTAADASGRLDLHQDLMADWVAGNPVGTGVGWEPYPTSLRIVNWIKWAWAGIGLEPSARESLAVQARWLRGRIETHLGGNHLFANAKALVFAGCYFEGPEARRWLSHGMSILEREVPEQVLPDGGYFERSTMYHALVFEDMLDLLNLQRACGAVFMPWAATVARWPDVARRMGRWLSAMCHPDEEIAFFNDAAMGIAPEPTTLTEYAGRLGVSWQDGQGDGVTWLEHSGYVRAERGGAVLFADVAPVGPDYLPAHAHADTLTFELSVRGQRVVVNSGTSCYGLGAQRQRERGTAAHNTVEVDGQDSSEVWAGFRVARRARPFDVTVREAADAVRVEGAHDGYRRLPGRVIHRRTWKLGDGVLEIVDHLEGRAGDAIARVHFHPEVQLEQDGGRGIARWDGDAVRWTAEDCAPIVVPSTWHPEFGVSMPSSALALRFGGPGQAKSCRLVLEWDRHDRNG